MGNDLQRFLDAKKREPRLIGDIERHLMRRPLGDRSTTVLHPSEIIKDDFCMKYSYYLMTGGESKKEKPNLRLQSIFDEGHAIHHKWQTWFKEMKVLYGRFECSYCKVSVTGVSPACSQCGREDLMEYKEVTLIDDELRIAGHTDGWIKGIGDDCLIEIKSVGSGTLRYEAPELLYNVDGDLVKAFNNIKRPFRSHLLQGQIYLELAKRMHKEKAPNEIVFLYELKADQSYKEFVVKADYEIVDRIFFKAEKVIKAVNANQMPECNINPEAGCKSCNLLVNMEAWGA